jgi:hypothetical protein
MNITKIHMSIINKACCLDKLIQIMKRHIIGVRKLVRLLGFEFGAITSKIVDVNLVIM